MSSIEHGPQDRKDQEYRPASFDWGGAFALVASFMVFFVIFVLMLFLILEFWPRFLRQGLS